MSADSSDSKCNYSCFTKGRSIPCSTAVKGRLCGQVENDSVSFESESYKPGFAINYSWEKSNSSDSASRSGSDKKTKQKSAENKDDKGIRVLPEIIKDRCRIAYAGSGSSYAIEGHGKRK